MHEASIDGTSVINLPALTLTATTTRSRALSPIFVPFRDKYLKLRLPPSR
jgi:hypothetical protein